MNSGEQKIGAAVNFVADNLDVAAVFVCGPVVGLASLARDPESTVQQEKSGSAALMANGKAAAGIGPAAIEIDNLFADFDCTAWNIVGGNAHSRFEFVDGTAAVVRLRVEVWYTAFAVHAATAGTGVVGRHNHCHYRAADFDPTHKASQLARRSFLDRPRRYLSLLLLA